MRIFKWGDGLAVELPADVVGHLKLKNGDEIDIRVVRGGTLEAVRSCEQEIARVRTLRKAQPATWKFDRDEANGR